MLKKSWAFCLLRATEELYSRPRVILLTRCNRIQIRDGCFDAGDVFLPVRSVTKDLSSSLGEIKQNARLLWHQGIPVRPFFSLPSRHLLEFVHVRAPLGQVTCSKNDCSYWVCVLDANVIGVLLTDENNKVLAPEATTVNRVNGTIWRGWVTKLVFLLQILLIFGGRCKSITLRCTAKNLQVSKI